MDDHIGELDKMLKQYRRIIFKDFYKEQYAWKILWERQFLFDFKR